LGAALEVRQLGLKTSQGKMNPENLQFQFHGNWGGPGYGAGEFTRSNDLDWNVEPVDNLDSLFREHDFNYGVMDHTDADKIFEESCGVKRPEPEKWF
jgi:hypothetical protein